MKVVQDAEKLDARKRRREIVQKERMKEEESRREKKRTGERGELQTQIRAEWLSNKGEKHCQLPSAN